MPTSRESAISYAFALQGLILRYEQAEWQIDKFRPTVEITGEHQQFHRFLVTTGGRVPSVDEVVGLLSMKLGMSVH